MKRLLASALVATTLLSTALVPVFANCGVNNGAYGYNNGYNNTANAQFVGYDPYGNPVYQNNNYQNYPSNQGYYDPTYQGQVYRQNQPGFLSRNPYVKNALVGAGVGAASSLLFSRSGNRGSGLLRGAVLGAGSGLALRALTNGLNNNSSYNNSYNNGYYNNGYYNNNNNSGGGLLNGLLGF